MARYPIQFGKYLLLERVNVGGMAEVFKCKTFGVAGFEKLVAIKRILPTMVEDEEFIRMFIDEARISVQLNHANVVQIYELGRQGDHYYIAMEYVPSRDLRTLLDKLRATGTLMPIPQAAFVASKICDALDYAHRKKDPSGQPMNIIHRDVSPQNVLVGYEGEVKVIDFGIAKAANRASKTQAGVLKGKFGYMSPEQVRGLPIDRRSDIFAVGVLLYEMLTGERLFIGESDFSTLEKVRNADVVAPTAYNKKITKELEGIVMKALAREVEDRYQWSSDLAEDLQPFLIEERSIYSTKRLASYMREAYAAEIAMEQAKMEEYLKITAPIEEEIPVEEFGPEKTFIFEASEMAKSPLATGASAAPQMSGKKAPLQSSKNPRVSTMPARQALEDEPSTDPARAPADDDDFVDHGASGELDARTMLSESPPEMDRNKLRQNSQNAPSSSANAAVGGVSRANAPVNVSGAGPRVSREISKPGGSSTSNPAAQAAANAAAAPVNGAPKGRPSGRAPLPPPKSENSLPAGKPINGANGHASTSGPKPNVSGAQPAVKSPPNTSGPREGLKPENLRANTGLKAALDDASLNNTGEILVDPSAATQAVNLQSLKRPGSSPSSATNPSLLVPPAEDNTGEALGSQATAPPATPAAAATGAKDAKDAKAAEKDAKDKAAKEAKEKAAKEAKEAKDAEKTARNEAKKQKQAQGEKTDTGPSLIQLLGPKRVAVAGGALVGVIALVLVLALVTSGPGASKVGTISVVGKARENVEVLVDGDLKDKKVPTEITGVTPGPHKLVIRGPGIMGFLKSVTVTAGAVTRLDAELDEEEPAGGAEDHKPPEDKKPAEVKCKPKDKECLKRQAAEKKAAAAEEKKEEKKAAAAEEKKEEKKAAAAEEKKEEKKAETPPAEKKEEKKAETPPAEKKEEKKAETPPAEKKEEKKAETPPAEKKEEKKPVAEKKEEKKPVAEKKEEKAVEKKEEKKPVAEKKEEKAAEKKEEKKPVAEKKEEKAAKKEDEKKAAAEPAELAIGTIPAGASVMVDGKDTKVQTPIMPSKALHLPSGKHTIVFAKDGVKYKYNVVLNPGPNKIVIPKLGEAAKEGNATFVP